MKWLLRLFDIHPELIQEEITSLIQNREITWVSRIFGFVSANEEEIEILLRRCYSIKFIILQPTVVNTSLIIDYEELKKFKTKDLEISYPDNCDFMVRSFRIDKRVDKNHREIIEGNLGGLVLSYNPELKVNLVNPTLKLYAVSWEKSTAFGWLYGENSYSQISWREPKKAPFFRGGTMKPRLCRLLVNLLHPLKPIILDPFCGHGGLLREIADMGSYAIGIEINKKITRELKSNNSYFGFDDRIAIIMGDALKSPFRKKSFQMEITDPPYAIQTTTRGMEREELVQKWLEKQESRTKIVITTPTNMLKELPKGWIMDFDGNDYVHKSLTRRARRIYRI